MVHKYFLPRGDLARRDWLNNFATELGVHATALSILTAVVTAMKADADYFDFFMKFLTSTTEYTIGLGTFKKQLSDNVTGSIVIADVPAFGAIPTHVAVLPGIFNRVKAFVVILKTNSALTPVMIADLGIEGDVIDYNFDDIVVDAKLSTKNGHPYSVWHRNGTDAVDIRADYGDGAGIIAVGRFTGLKFLDAHLPPDGTSAAFKYYYRYVVNDEQVGIWSNAISMVVHGLSVI